MNRQAADLEDVLAESRGVDLLLPVLGPGARLHSALLDEVRDDVNPLAVPTEDARPHLEALVRLQLLLETALCAAQHDAEGALRGPRWVGRVHDEFRLGIIAEHAAALGE